jgi:hypothetical protein
MQIALEESTKYQLTLVKFKIEFAISITQLTRLNELENELGTMHHRRQRLGKNLGLFYVRLSILIVFL